MEKQSIILSKILKDYSQLKEYIKDLQNDYPNFVTLQSAFFEKGLNSNYIMIDDNFDNFIHLEIDDNGLQKFNNIHPQDAKDLLNQFYFSDKVKEFDLDNIIDNSSNQVTKEMMDSFLESSPKVANYIDSLNYEELKGYTDIRKLDRRLLSEDDRLDSSINAEIEYLNKSLRYYETNISKEQFKFLEVFLKSEFYSKYQHGEKENLVDYEKLQKDFQDSVTPRVFIDKILEYAKDINNSKVGLDELFKKDKINIVDDFSNKKDSVLLSYNPSYGVLRKMLESNGDYNSKDSNPYNNFVERSEVHLRMPTREIFDEVVEKLGLKDDNYNRATYKLDGISYYEDGYPILDEERLELKFNIQNRNRDLVSVTKTDEKLFDLIDKYKLDGEHLYQFQLGMQKETELINYSRGIAREKHKNIDSILNRDELISNAETIHSTYESPKIDVEFIFSSPVEKINYSYDELLKEKILNLYENSDLSVDDIKEIETLKFEYYEKTGNSLDDEVDFDYGSYSVETRACDSWGGLDSEIEKFFRLDLDKIAESSEYNFLHTFNDEFLIFNKEEFVEFLNKEGYKLSYPDGKIKELSEYEKIGRDETALNEIKKEMLGLDTPAKEEKNDKPNVRKNR